MAGKSPKFDFQEFTAFCQALQIDSKEDGLVPLRFLGTQRFLLQEIAAGLEEEIRHFVILKGRQLGISTASLALDLYWMVKYDGLQGAIVTDTDANRDFFKSVLDDYFESLPRSHKVPPKINNRNQLVLHNRSRLGYLVAGVRQSGNLGRSRAINFLHATEVSSWADEEGLISLMSTLAETYAHRLYIFESTARGYNLYADMWEDAKRAYTQKAIFIGWWRNERYAYGKDTPIYRIYWDGKLKSDEKEWIKAIKHEYDFEITPEQIAWYRWKLAEEIRDETLMMQEFPPTPEYAFVVSGLHYFSSAKLSEAAKKAKSIPFKSYRYVFGLDWADTEFTETIPTHAELKIWEEPKPEGLYVLGADPAYGSNPDGDGFCVQVFRCFTNRAYQVAEYRTTQLNATQFAWVILQLSAWYKQVTVNLELSGPGWTTLQELHNVQRSGGLMRGQFEASVGNIFGQISHYLYTRPDSLSGHFLLHTITNPQNKRYITDSLRDCFETGYVELNSLELLKEMKYVTNDKGYIGAQGRAKDDRVMAASLAVKAWRDQVRIYALNQGTIYQESPVDQPPRSVQEWVQKSLAAHNIQ